MFSSNLYLEAEVLFCSVKFSSQFIGRRFLSRQILTGVLNNHWSKLTINGWTVGMWVTIKYNFFMCCWFCKFNITSRAALRRSISRLRIVSFSISLKKVFIERGKIFLRESEMFWEGERGTVERTHLSLFSSLEGWSIILHVHCSFWWTAINISLLFSRRLILIMFLF